MNEKKIKIYEFLLWIINGKQKHLTVDNENFQIIIIAIKATIELQSTVTEKLNAKGTLR